jgi:hypothetical protein
MYWQSKSDASALAGKTITQGLADFGLGMTVEDLTAIGDMGTHMYRGIARAGSLTCCPYGWLIFERALGAQSIYGIRTLYLESAVECNDSVARLVSEMKKIDLTDPLAGKIEWALQAALSHQTLPGADAVADEAAAVAATAAIVAASTTPKGVPAVATPVLAVGEGLEDEFGGAEVDDRHLR